MPDLSDPNHPPDLEDATFAISEDAVPTTSVGTVQASDPDANDTIEFSIFSGDPGGLFAIDSESGEITLDGSLNFEDSPVFDLVVKGTDTGGLEDTASVTVNLVDINEPPVIADGVFSVGENSTGSTDIGSVVADDPDANDTILFVIISESPAGSAIAQAGPVNFAIGESSGEITVAQGANLDFETTAVWNLTVRATDSGELGANGSITINITDLNEKPSAEDGAFTVAEDVAVTGGVGTVTGSDPDAGDTLEFRIDSGDPSGRFRIDSASGIITVAAALDHEADSEHVLAVVAKDGGGLEDIATVTITVSDVNESPVIADAAYSVSENSPATTAVGTILADDIDDGDTISYQITTEVPGGSAAVTQSGPINFAIGLTSGQITVAQGANLDFESTAVWILTVRATDQGGLGDSASVTVDLTDANEHPTADDSAFTVAEDAAVTAEVGAVPATDPDSNDTLEFRIDSGDPNGLFAIDSASGVIRVAAALDHEGDPEHVITVIAKDGGGLEDPATVTVTVTDVNEPPAIGATAFTIDENSPAGADVGSVLATDPDATGTIAYAITAETPTGGAYTAQVGPFNFAIGEVSGQITVAPGADLNFESVSQWDLTVRATDSGGLGTDASVTIDIVDLNERPSAEDAAFTIPAFALPNTQVGAVAATDPDAGDTLAFRIDSGDPNSVFDIDGASGLITVAAPLTPVEDSVQLLTVAVTDRGGLEDTAAVAITVVGDINEPPVFANAAFSISETAPEGAVVGSVTGDDPDAADSLSYAITAEAQAGSAAVAQAGPVNFAIGDVSGQITVAQGANLDFETAASWDLNVRATDTGGLSADATVTIEITDENEPPDATDVVFNVAENAAVDSLVSRIINKLA